MSVTSKHFLLGFIKALIGKELVEVCLDTHPKPLFPVPEKDRCPAQKKMVVRVTVRTSVINR